MTASRVDVAALEAAMEKASPRPWRVPEFWPNSAQSLEQPAPMEHDTWEHLGALTRWPDAELAVLAVNAAPALVALVRAVEALHRPMVNDNSGDPACPDCLGGINVPEDEIDDPRPCGCWGLLTPICGSCADFHGNKRYPLQWPCPTASAVGAALNPQETGR